MFFKKKQRPDVYRPLSVSNFVTPSVNRIKEGLMSRCLTASDVINIETTETGYVVWYKHDVNRLTPFHTQYPHGLTT